MRSVYLATGASALAMVVSAASANFSITNGNAVFEYVGSNSNPFSNSSINTYNFRPDGGATTDHVFYYNWGYRVPSSSNTGMSVLVSPTISNPDASTVVLTMNNNGQGPLGQARFDSSVTMQIVDGAAPGAATILSTLNVTAATSNTGPVTYQFFHVNDVDFNGTASNDVYNITNPLGVDGTVIDSALSSPAVSGLYNGAGASLFQLGASSTMRGIINGSSIANLNGTSTFSGDGAYGFQWTVTLAPGESASFTTSFTTIPAPSAIGLLALGAPAAFRRRR